MPTPFLHRRSCVNFLQAVFVVAIMFVLVLAIGWLLFGSFGIVFAFGFLVYSLITLRGLPTAMVMNRFQARAISVYEAPELVAQFQDLVAKARIAHVVDLYYLPTATPNAFAVGSGEDAAVCVSDGLLRMLNERELSSVFAHELSHIKHKDTQLMSLAQTMGRVTGLFSRMGLLGMLFAIPIFSYGMGSIGTVIAAVLLLAAPIFNIFLQLSLSRTREFNADLGSADITRDPLGLVSALLKLEGIAGGGWIKRNFDPRARMHEPTWLRTHPSTSERVERLKAVHESMQTLESEQSSRFVDVPFHTPVTSRRQYRPITGTWRFPGNSTRYPKSDIHRRV